MDVGHLWRRQRIGGLFGQLPDAARTEILHRFRTGRRTASGVYTDQRVFAEEDTGPQRYYPGKLLGLGMDPRSAGRLPADPGLRLAYRILGRRSAGFVRGLS